MLALWSLAALSCIHLTLHAAASESTRLNGYKGQWLSEGAVFLVRNFVSKSQVRKLRGIAEHLFSSREGPDWEHRAVNEAFAAFAQPIPELSDLEDSIANLTGIQAHKDETPLYFTQHRAGALPRGSYVHGIHHDKNLRERRSVTVLIYLTSARLDEDGGHTLFLQLPRGGSPPEPSSPPGESTDAADRDVVPYFRRTFEQAFRQGRRELLPYELAETPHDVWDARALQLAERECALALEGRSHALAVRPKRGSAVVFWNAHPDGSPTMHAWHTACHAVKGSSRSAVQKFKEPLPGDALEDQLGQGGKATEL